MERRLIYRGAHGPSEGPILPDSEHVREDVIMHTAEQLSPLERSVCLPAIRDAVSLSENKEALYRRVSRNFEDIPVHVNAIAVGYAAILTPERQRALLENLNIGDQLEQELGVIMESITQPVETGGAIEHRYLRSKEAPEGYPSWYGIDFHKIEADKKLVQTLKEANPAFVAELSEIENALNEYARPDPSLPADRWGIIHANEGDKQILGMAKFVAIIVAGTAAALTGVMAIKRKEGYTAPLLYAGVTGLLAFPQLRRGIFGSQHESVLAQVDATVNSRDFKENARIYDVAGPEWHAFAEDVMHNPGETKTFLKTLSRHPTGSPLNADVIDEYVNSAMPAGEGREQLRRMILEERFPAFADRLMSATNADARDVVLEYIERGAIRFEHMAERSADEVNRLMRPARRNNYLGGNLNAD